MNGNRHPHARIMSRGRTLVSNVAIAEPNKVPAQVPKRHQVPMKPRRCGMLFSTTKTIEVVYSPPTEMPCARRKRTSNTDAVTPIC